MQVLSVANTYIKDDYLTVEKTDLVRRDERG